MTRIDGSQSAAGLFHWVFVSDGLPVGVSLLTAQAVGVAGSWSRVFTVLTGVDSRTCVRSGV